MSSTISNLNTLSERVLKIIRVKGIENKFGGSYICNSSDGTSVFSNKRVTEFINNNPGKLPFTLKINSPQTFTKGGQEFTFNPVECY